MTATFLITLNLSYTSALSLTQLAGDIDEDLTAVGHDVEEVKPWARPSLLTGAPAPATQVAPPPPPKPFT